MATVYLAENLRHQRSVALKVLKPELAAVVGAERFLAEMLAGEPPHLGSTPPAILAKVLTQPTTSITVLHSGSSWAQKKTSDSPIGPSRRRQPTHSRHWTSIQNHLRPTSCSATCLRWDERAGHGLDRERAGPRILQLLSIRRIEGSSAEQPP